VGEVYAHIGKKTFWTTKTSMGKSC